MLFEHDTTLEEAIRFSRFDEENWLSTVSNHPFELESCQWSTAEHYYQAHKFEGLPYEKIIIAEVTGQAAYEAGNRWFKRKVTRWKSKRRIWMTRALYRKVMEFPEIKQKLLETKDALIIETSQYDHYWGIARDQRGENMLGKVWMDIRDKIQSE